MLAVVRKVDVSRITIVCSRIIWGTANRKNFRFWWWLSGAVVIVMIFLLVRCLQWSAIQHSYIYQLSHQTPVRHLSSQLHMLIYLLPCFSIGFNWTSYLFSSIHWHMMAECQLHAVIPAIKQAGFWICLHNYAAAFLYLGQKHLILGLWSLMYHRLSEYGIQQHHICKR